MAENVGLTALHFSAGYGSYELLRYFADMGVDIHLKNNIGYNCLHIAALNGHLNLCKILIDKHKFDIHMAENVGLTALHFSAGYGTYELLRYFADMGVDIHLKSNSGLNCLHIATYQGHLNLCKILIDKHNFDIHVATNGGWTALHYSAKYGSYELLRYFADMGVDIHLKTNNGWNCLHIAALKGHLHLCKILIDKHNFNIFMPTNDNRLPLHCSAENGSFELFLYFFEKKSEVYGKLNNMKNALHLASGNGHFEICEFVLKYFIEDYIANNSKKQHTLHGTFYSSQIFYRYDTIFLHAMDVDGNTYLHLAAEGNHAKVCELLLKYDTEIITLLNKEDKTALEIAKDNSHWDVLNALKAEYERKGQVFKLSCYIFQKILEIYWNICITCSILNEYILLGFKN